MGNVQHKGKDNGLSAFQKRKLKYDFYTFFDLNHDGHLSYTDFLWAKDKICQMSGWKIDSPKYKITGILFKEIWESLEAVGDIDKDGKISQEEWLTMWTFYKSVLIAKEKEDKDFLKKYYQQKMAVPVHEDNTPEESCSSMDPLDEIPIILDSDEEPPPNLQQQKFVRGRKADKGIEETQKAKTAPRIISGKSMLEKFADRDLGDMWSGILPKWLFKYLIFRFNLLDRTGDNVIDHEEYEYVLSEFGVSEKTARQAFTIFTENNTKPLDFDYFVRLFEEYYLSDDPSSLGNFINGKLDFNEDDDNDEGTNETNSDPSLGEENSTKLKNDDELSKSKSCSRRFYQFLKNTKSKCCNFL